jgi:hypothetical protein
MSSRRCPRRNMTAWYGKLRPRILNSQHLAQTYTRHFPSFLPPQPMAHYDIFSAQLAIKYPAYGHALWVPPPVFCPAEVGDVGFIREGRFHRLFNALLPADHPSHTLGVPEYHEPLVPSVSDHIFSDTLSPSHYSSAGVDVVIDEPDIQALG